MQLSENFTLKEFTKSTTAARLRIDNTPDADAIDNLCTLCESVLQPVRDHFGRVTINSGFRILELNRALKSKDRSQHRLGEAADIEVNGISNYDLACWIRDNLEFDQLILEFYNDSDPSAGWVHVSFREGSNRNQCITVSKSGTTLGLG